jgi:hypothetical protein
MPPIVAADYPVGRFRARVITRNGVAPSGGLNFDHAIDTPGSSGVLNPVTPTSVVTDTNQTPWLEWDAADNNALFAAHPNNQWASRGFPFLIRCRTRFNIVDPMRVEYQIEFHVERAGTIYTFDVILKRQIYQNAYAASSTDAVGLCVAIDREAGTNLPRARKFSTYEQDEFFNTLETFPEVNPKPSRFWLMDRHIMFDDEVSGWQKGWSILRRFGMNVQTVQPRELVFPELDPATYGEGIAHGVFRPAGDVTEAVLPYGYDASPTFYTDWGANTAAGFVTAGVEDRVRWFAISDEPHWYFTSDFIRLQGNAAGLARYRAWLQEQRPNGVPLTPADLGFATWAAVVPENRSALCDTNLTNRRNWYWSARFLSYESTRHHALSAQALMPHVPNAAVITNWNNYVCRWISPGPTGPNPSDPSHLRAAMFHDYWEFAREGGSNAIVKSDWFGDGDFFKWFWMAAQASSAARAGGIEWIAYPIGVSTGSRRWGMKTKIFAAVSCGAKQLYYYLFGPEILFPGSCYSNREDPASPGTPLSPPVLARIGEAHQVLGDYEDILFPGVPLRSEVALLAPRSCQAHDYRPYTLTGLEGGGAFPLTIRDITNSEPNFFAAPWSVELYNLWFALLHKGVHTELVDEDELTVGALGRYRVLYVTCEELPEEHTRAILDWVRAGGVLCRTTLAMQRDRYSEPLTTLTDAIGTREADRAKIVVDSAYGGTTNGNVDDGVSAAQSAWWGRGTFDSYEGEVLATWTDDGSPAILKQRLGRGTVFTFGWYPGISYAHSQDGTFADQIRQGHSTVLRNWIKLPVDEAAIAPAVSLVTDRLNWGVLENPDTWAVFLFNNRGAAVASEPVVVRPPFRVASILRVGTGAVTFEQVGAGPVTFSTQVAEAELLILTAEAGTTEGRKRVRAGSRGVGRR